MISNVITVGEISTSYVSKMTRPYKGAWFPYLPAQFPKQERGGLREYTIGLKQKTYP